MPAASITWKVSNQNNGRKYATARAAVSPLRCKAVTRVCVPIKPATVPARPKPIAKRIDWLVVWMADFCSRPDEPGDQGRAADAHEDTVTGDDPGEIVGGGLGRLVFDVLCQDCFGRGKRRLSPD